MPISLTTKSRLRFKEFLSIYGVEFWELDVLPVIPESPADYYYYVTAQDRIDLLATRFYGDPNLWWVIASANNLDILPTNLVEGTTIRIPSPTYVTETLFTTDAVVQT